MSDGTTSVDADGASVPFGIYFDTGVRRIGLVGGAVLLALGCSAAFLGVAGEVDWLDAGLATLTGSIGSAGIWSMAVRPRLEVSRRGLVVVNPARTIEIPWAEVDSFDCHYSLMVCRSDGSSVVVAALPANGLRRITSATPGRVDRLAIQLNVYVATAWRPGTARARVCIETPEGRRDIRVFAAMAILGVVATAALRHLLG